MKYEELKLNDNTATHRLELVVDGITSFIEYKQSNGNLFLIHTEVPDTLEGKGVGSAMVEKAFQHAEASGLKIVPLCSFVQLYVKRHQEWDHLIAPDSARYKK